MKIVDAHVHLDRVAGEDILRMAWGGVRVGIIPTPHLIAGLFTAATVMQLWDKTLGYMVEYAASLGIDCYATLAVPFYGLNKDGYAECLKALPSYLKEHRVVGVGEIGLDNGNDHEVTLFREQLAIAREYNLPVIIHTPTPREPQVSKITSKIIAMLKKNNFPLEKAVLDHTGKKTFRARVSSGCVTGLSICYDKLTAEDAAGLIIENPDIRSKIILGSELGYGGAGHLSLVKVAWVLRMEGMEEKEIEKVTWGNATRLFGLPVK